MTTENRRITIVIWAHRATVPQLIFLCWFSLVSLGSKCCTTNSNVCGTNVITAYCKWREQPQPSASGFWTCPRNDRLQIERHGLYYGYVSSPTIQKTGASAMSAWHPLEKKQEGTHAQIANLTYRWGILGMSHSRV